MPRDDGAILAHLSDAGVDYVVIGGWAVIAHGYVRATRDVDVLVADSPAVRRRVTEALAALDAKRLDGSVLAPDRPMPDQAPIGSASRRRWRAGCRPSRAAKPCACSRGRSASASPTTRAWGTEPTRTGDPRSSDTIRADAVTRLEVVVVMVTDLVGSTALASAVRIQQELELRNRCAEVPMGVRIGISVGDASVEAGDYFGIPSIEAARLCSAAGGSEILVPDPLRMMLRGHAAQQLESAGALLLKGLPERVIAWKVLWQPRPQGAGPLLPPRLRGVPEPAFVGRRNELRILSRSWDHAAAGEPQLVVVSGEPGIGKTRLVTELIRTALPENALILYGRCDGDHRIPYHPWLELLRDFAEVAPRRVLRPHSSELSRLVPGLAQRLGTVPTPLDIQPAPLDTVPAPPARDTGTGRYLLFQTVQTLLARAAACGPVLVILDDLQWADSQTLLLLKYLVASPTADRLMFIATYRDCELAPGDPLSALLADLHRVSGVTRLALAGLDATEIVDLIRGGARRPIDRVGLALAGEARRETAGNPLFVAEILRHLGPTWGTVKQPEGRLSFTSGLPDQGLPSRVREVIERRLRRLGDCAREVLSVAAVMGRQFDPALLAQAVDLPATRVLDLLDEAIEASLVRPVGEIPSFLGLRPLASYRFNHGIVQAMLSEAIPTGRRAALHRAVGGAAQAPWGSDAQARLPELARHLLRAAPVGGGETTDESAGHCGPRHLRFAAASRTAGSERFRFPGPGMATRHPTAPFSGRLEAAVRRPGPPVRSMGRRYSSGQP